MPNLNQSEAETFEHFLKGEELWSWPNGKVQLGQTIPDLAIINRLVRGGFLDEHYQPTEVGRLAFQFWLNSRRVPSPAPLATSQSENP